MIPIIIRNRQYVIFFVLVFSVIASLCGGFLLRFDFDLNPIEWGQLGVALLLAVPIKIAIFYLVHLHKGWWSQIGLADVKAIARGALLGSAAASAAIFAWVGFHYSRSVYVIDFLLSILLLFALRLTIRLYHDYRCRKKITVTGQKVLIYGAGWAGAALVKEARTNPSLHLDVVGFLDDDRTKWKDMLLGVRVLGSGAHLAAILEKLRDHGAQVDQILIAMPSATGAQMRNAISECKAAGIPCKTLPGVGSLLAGKGLTSQIRDIAVEDLLGREPVELDEDTIRAIIVNSRVLVTGAAGSIGSELCRQIVSYTPEQLILLDQAESALFHIDLELRQKFGFLNITAELGDVRNREKLDEILERYKIDVIFHAAAYKHVPMMESHVLEAAQNNVAGTWNLAKAAADHGVKTFIMISSDKAVNPANIMGATKRAAELIVSCFGRRSSTTFVSVRFGNVLGSNGSVVPIFKAQIEARGPVTVTHPEVRRYFMTVREAVQLVLQASSMGKGSEIFVLDMGEPVRIVDLARNMISLAGLIPDQDVRIEFTGLRPGEKLYEELITGGENILPTYHKKIKIFQGRAADYPMIHEWMQELHRLIDRRDKAAVVAHISALVPEYELSPYWADALQDRGFQPADARIGPSNVLPLKARKTAAV